MNQPQMRSLRSFPCLLATIIQVRLMLIGAHQSVLQKPQNYPAQRMQTLPSQNIWQNPCRRHPHLPEMVLLHPNQIGPKSGNCSDQFVLFRRIHQFRYRNRCPARLHLHQSHHHYRYQCHRRSTRQLMHPRNLLAAFRHTHIPNSQPMWANRVLQNQNHKYILSFEYHQNQFGHHQPNRHRCP